MNLTDENQGPFARKALLSPQWQVGPSAGGSVDDKASSLLLH